jgi:hypothetical protein
MELSTMQNVLERVPLARLKPEDFCAQLYFAVCAGMAELTSREAVVCGQELIMLSVLCSGRADRGVIFDRPEGGEPVLSGLLVPWANCQSGGFMTIHLQWPPSRSEKMSTTWQWGARA